MIKKYRVNWGGYWSPKKTDRDLLVNREIAVALIYTDNEHVTAGIEG